MVHTCSHLFTLFQGVDDRRLAGDMLAVRKDLPYQGLGAFGTGFLSRCGAGQMFEAMQAWEGEQLQGQEVVKGRACHTRGLAHLAPAPSAGEVKGAEE